MWAKIVQLLAKAAVWAADHPDQVIQAVQDIKKAKDALKK